MKSKSQKRGIEEVRDSEARDRGSQRVRSEG